MNLQVSTCDGVRVELSFSQGSPALPEKADGEKGSGSELAEELEMEARVEVKLEVEGEDMIHIVKGLRYGMILDTNTLLGQGSEMPRRKETTQKFQPLIGLEHCMIIVLSIIEYS